MNISLRKFIRSIMLVALLLGCVLSLPAQQVTQKAALKKAEQFLGKASLSRRAPHKAPQLTLANNRDEFYVFNDKANGGYVIVSGEERMPDVLAYSYDSRFDADNIPCNMKAWLEGYAEQVKYLRTHPEASARRTTPERENIGPLMTCWFSQDAPYNDKCPVIDGKHGYTGCVATAMAQIMYYWQWPKKTTDDIPAYITEYLKIEMPEIPITEIDWDNILGEYKSEESYTAQQIDAISTLMLLCGASVHMNYWEYGSSATTHETVKALREYFSYDGLLDLLKRYEFSTEDWEDMIYDELKDRRPVLYRGGNYEEGHAFVLDGYKDGYFHVNWGWGGLDAYVLMTSVAGWEKYGNGHEAIVGIQPATTDTPILYAVVDNGKMSFYYDKEKTHRPGTILPYKEDWANYKKETTECVIDPSFANIKQKRMAEFFSKFFSRWYELELIEGLENLNTSMLTDMSEMFLYCSNLKSLDLSGFKTDNVTNMESMFCGCSSLTNLDVSSFRTDKVTNMNNMFCDCSSLTSLDLDNFDTSNVNDMRSMFAHCSSLTDLDLSSFKTDKVTNMSYMFNECKSLTNLDVSTFRTNKVTQMKEMFYRCSMLVSIDVSGFRIDKVTLMTSMFEGCSSLSSLDLSSFKTDMVKDVGGMFRYCSQLLNVYVSESWNLHNAEFTYSMFAGCSSIVGGKGTTYDSKHVGGDYAHIDEGPSNPGYFTYKAPPIIPGDVNGDGVVNVTDIVATVNYIMEKPSDGFNKEAADLNGDGEINVTDIVKMVSIIMSGEN